MRENLRAELYTEELLSVSELAKWHANISEGMAVAPALIYRDPNFEYYLENFLLKSEDDFTVLLIDHGVVAGFCRLKIIPDILFYNNLYITDQAQGKGYGGLLFLETARKSLNGQDLKFFQLDVFLSNERAHKWYKKLGLEEIARTYWYEVKTGQQVPETNASTVTFATDDKGFTGIFTNEGRIGSLLNNSVVLLTGPEGLKYLNNFTGNRVFFKSAEPFDSDSIECVLADISIRMSQSLETTLYNLSQDIKSKNLA